jgi:hypothetical protein
VTIEVISIDVDSSLFEQWQPLWVSTRKAMLNSLGLKLVDVVARKSGDCLPWRGLNKPGKGYHVWLHVDSDHPLEALEKLKLQFLLGDDLGRVWINFLRITKRDNPNWEKIFGYIVERSPLPEPCGSCRLRKHLEELQQDAQENSKSCWYDHCPSICEFAGTPDCPLKLKKEV